MSNRFHVATRKGIFSIERKASGWAIQNVSFLGDNCSMVMHDPRPTKLAGDRSEGALYAALGHGHFGVKMHRSFDGGKTWNPIGTPAYPEKPADYKPRVPAEGKVYDWVLQLVWALNPGGPKQDGLLWCGTLPGGLFKSENHGETWELVRSLWDRPEREEWFGGGADFPGIHSVCVNPSDPNHIILGVSCGGAWITRDGGRSWNSGGKGMRAEYMPPERAYDLVFRHALDIDESGERLAFGSTTGSLWISEDCGDSWQTVSNHLPPVYAVRFEKPIPS